MYDQQRTIKFCRKSYNSYILDLPRNLQELENGDHKKEVFRGKV